MSQHPKPGRVLFSLWRRGLSFASYQQCRTTSPLSRIYFQIKNRRTEIPFAVIHRSLNSRDSTQNSAGMFFYLDDETSTIMPLKVTKCFERLHHVDMLLLAEDDKKHYILIKNLTGLFQDKTNHNNPCFSCRYCFRRCSTSVILEKHGKNCKRHPPQVVLYPKPAVKGMAQIENDGSEDEFYNEYDDVSDQFELADMRAADRENIKSSGDFPEVSVNLNDGDLNRPYKFNPLRGYDIKKDESKNCFKNFRKTFFVPFCFHLDFKSYLVKTTDRYDREIHVLNGFCCLRVSERRIRRVQRRNRVRI